jgi:hypothetical protein
VVGAPLDQCEEAVLRSEWLRGPRASAGERSDPPLAGVSGTIGEPRLVGAVEVAETDVDDASRRDLPAGAVGCRESRPVQLSSRRPVSVGASQLERPPRQRVDQIDRYSLGCRERQAALDHETSEECRIETARHVVAHGN